MRLVGAVALHASVPPNVEVPSLMPQPESRSPPHEPSKTANNIDIVPDSQLLMCCRLSDLVRWKKAQRGLNTQKVPLML